jgi:hypothetical protein
VPDAVPDEAGRAWPDEAVGAMPDEAVGAVPDETVKPVPVEQRVREQVAALDGIEDVPLAEHAQRYDEVHAALQAALVEIDGESG